MNRKVSQRNKGDLPYKQKGLSKKKFKKQQQQMESTSRRVYASKAEEEKTEAIEVNGETIPITEPGFSREIIDLPIQSLPTDREGQRKYLREKRAATASCAQ